MRVVLLLRRPEGRRVGGEAQWAGNGVRAAEHREVRGRAISSRPARQAFRWIGTMAHDRLRRRGDRTMRGVRARS